ncbi:type II toxin-antitoxin system RelE/ParE family toxin [Rhizobium sp.]
MTLYELEVYETRDGKAPFQDWLTTIRDKTARTLLNAQVRKAQLGNFGDWKRLSGTDGICEMRVHHGPGFRIYYFIVGQTVILLLAGSSKKDQDRTIAKAKQYLSDYKTRESHDARK